MCRGRSFGRGRACSGQVSVRSRCARLGVPPQLAHQISQIAHDVFAYGFIDAMRVTLIVPIAAIGVGAASCLAIKRRPRGRAAARAAASDAAAL